MISKSFSAKELFEKYKVLKKNKKHMNNFIKICNMYKKRKDTSEPKTLQEIPKLKGWLVKHSGRLSRLWFIRNDNGFKLLKKHVKELTGYLNSI